MFRCSQLPIPKCGIVSELGRLKVPLFCKCLSASFGYVDFIFMWVKISGKDQELVRGSLDKKEGSGNQKKVKNALTLQVVKIEVGRFP